MTKYTDSEDGVERATVWLSFRFTREELADIRRVAKHQDCDWRTMIASWGALAIEDGVSCALEEIE